jgi:hypothetical protein
VTISTEQQEKNVHDMVRRLAKRKQDLKEQREKKAAEQGRKRRVRHGADEEEVEEDVLGEAPPSEVAKQAQTKQKRGKRSKPVEDEEESEEEEEVKMPKKRKTPMGGASQKTPPAKRGKKK